MTSSVREGAATDVPRMTGARIFVTTVFVLLGAMFIASTALLVHEFNDRSLPALVMMHSHLFVFFPVLGILALAAFRLPAIVFTHIYWTSIRFGKIRFLLGTAVVLAATIYTSWGLTNSAQHSIWELTPAVIAADRATPPNCNDTNGPCNRARISDALMTLRQAAAERTGLSEFARVCTPDPLLEVPDSFTKARYCFPALGKLDGARCCEVQKRFATAINANWSDEDKRSMSQIFDLIALPAKTFFVIVVLVIGVLLTIWRRKLEDEYAPLAPSVERSMLIGALAMLPWPVMDYAHLQAMQTLVGRWSTQPDMRLSLVIAPWTLLLLFYFLGRMSRKIERLGQLAGAVASIIALLRYEQLNDWGVRVLGIGAPLWSIGIIVVLAVGGFVALTYSIDDLKPRPRRKAVETS